MGGDSKVKKTSEKLGLPAELIQEAEGLKTSSEVYPDNWTTVCVFRQMIGQWRVGMNGAYGFDYTALQVIPAVRRMKDEDEYEDFFTCFQIMEKVALEGQGDSK